MSDIALRVATAATLLWLGMVLAISFLEAPLKFRAPGLHLRTGLATGRIVFRALNGAEVAWAAVLATTLIAHAPSTQTIGAGHDRGADVPIGRRPTATQSAFRSGPGR